MQAYELTRRDLEDAGKIAERVWGAVFELIDAEPEFTGDEAGEIAEAATRAAKRAVLDVIARC